MTRADGLPVPRGAARTPVLIFPASLICWTLVALAIAGAGR